MQTNASDVPDPARVEDSGESRIIVSNFETLLNRLGPSDLEPGPIDPIVDRLLMIAVDSKLDVERQRIRDEIRHRRQAVLSQGAENQPPKDRAKAVPSTPLVHKADSQPLPSAKAAPADVLSFSDGQKRSIRNRRKVKRVARRTTKANQHKPRTVSRKTAFLEGYARRAAKARLQELTQNEPILVSTLAEQRAESAMLRRFLKNGTR
jgi:hypothetical protein